MFYLLGVVVISNVLLLFVKMGDYILMVDVVYEFIWDFCDKILVGLGIEIIYYLLGIGVGISEFIKENMCVLFLELLGLIIMEV